MAFNDVQRPKLEVVKGWGNRSRTFTALRYFMDVSNANTAVSLATQQFEDSPGRIRSARIAYVPLDCAESVACGAGLCSTGTPIAPVVRNFDITQCTATPVRTLRQQDIRLVDGEWDVNSYALEMIGAMLPKFREEIAKDMISRAYTLRGRHADGTDSKRLPMVTNQTNGVITPVGMYAIEKEYMDAGHTNPYVLGGGTDFFNYRKTIEIGGLDNNGQYVNRMPGDNLYYDDSLQRQLFNDTVNGDWALAINPAMFKLVFYHQNVGEFSTDLKGINNINQLFKGSSGPGNDFILSTMQDPTTGLIFDFFANFDKCTLQWHWHLELQWDMFVMPDINCGPVGFNGITIYRTCPEVIINCPAGSPVASPTAATVRSWNPSFTYPQYISQATIGGVTKTFVNPVTITNDADTVAMMNDAFGSAVFTLNGANIQYTGYSNYSVSFNNGQITGSFS